MEYMQRFCLLLTYECYTFRHKIKLTVSIDYLFLSNVNCISWTSIIKATSEVDLSKSFS